VLHKNRVWNISEVSSKEELAEKLTQYTWTGCTGWKLGKVLFLNDSTCADGAQEYAAVIEPHSGEFFQIESITFSWCTYEQALHHIEDIMSYAEGKQEPPIRWPVKVNLNHGQKCYLCA